MPSPERARAVAAERANEPEPPSPSPAEPSPVQPGETPLTEPQTYPIHPEIPVQPIHENDPTRC